MTATPSAWSATPIPARQDGESLEAWVERAWAAADDGDLISAGKLHLDEYKSLEELTALPASDRNQILAAIPWV